MNKFRGFQGFLDILNILFRRKDRWFSTGIALIATGTTSFVAGHSISVSHEQTLVSYTLGETSFLFDLLMYAVILTGLVMILIRVKMLYKSENTRDIGIIYFPGYDRLDPRLNTNEQGLDANIIARLSDTQNMPLIDSREPAQIKKRYSFLAQTVQANAQTSEDKENYVKVLGSVPYCYLVGALYRDGHKSIHFIDHDRKTDKGYLPDKPLSTIPKFQVLFNGKSDKNLVANTVSANVHREMGVAIAFTQDILSQDIPEELREHTIFIEPGDLPKNFDLLPNEELQADIATQISHLMTSLHKKSDQLHLFICAQASFVARLGKLFQEGMHGQVVLHNWNANESRYDWYIQFNGDIVLT